MISSCYLHNAIREKGGAYGAGLSSGPVIAYYSYRDPNIESTFKVFDDAQKWVLENKTLTERDLEEAKLSVFSDLDHPIAPAAKGSAYFTRRITDEMRQQRRDRLFAVTLNDCMKQL